MENTTGQKNFEGLTRDTNLIGSDIISTRLQNLMWFNKWYTIRDLSYLKKSELRMYRGCGKQTLEEVDKLLKMVGLTWGRQSLTDIPDEQLIEECERRGFVVKRIES